MYYKLNIKSLDSITLRLYIKFLKILFLKLNIKNAKCIFIPKKKKRLTLLKSSHVHKKAREQFQLTQYKVFIIINTNYIFNFLFYLLINKPKNIKISILTIV